MGKFKVFVIGLDGASFDVFYSLAEDGVLTNIKKLMKGGCFGVLRSTIPPNSPVAFTSLLTGKNPGKHGVFNFGRLNKGVFMPHTSKSIKGGTLWDVLTKVGKRVILLNVPFTYPPYEVNGIMVSGFPAQRANKMASYPHGFISFLNSKIGGYHVDVTRYIKRDYEGLDEKKFLEEVYLVTRKRAEAMLYLMENYDWDFFMMVETSLDRIQHLLFGYFDKDSPFYDEEKRELLIKYYKEIDDIVGKILSNIDENTILIIVSDHGFEPLYKYVGVNNLLVQGGFTKTKSKLRIFTRVWIENLVRFLHEKGIKTDKIISSKIISKAGKMIPSRYDSVASRAYCVYTYPPCGSVNINKKLKEEKYESIRKRLIDYLYSVIDEENGERIVERIYDKDEIYSGNYLDDAPDLMVIFRRGYEPKFFRKSGTERLKQTKNRTVKTGTHSGFSAQRGVFIISGKGIKNGFLTETNMVDIAPTIMHILGVPIPSDADGRVLTETFEPDSKFAKEPIKYQEVVSRKKGEVSRLSKEEEEYIKKRLEKLGYM